jgi:TusA-related sulfurtransferase
MIKTAKSQPQIIDIKDLGFDRGAHLLVKRALADVPAGERLGIRGRAPELAIHLRAWCHSQGHEIIWPESDDERKSDQSTAASPLVAWIARRAAVAGRWRGAERAGASNPNQPSAIVERPPGTWGLAARGARVESGAPQFQFGISSKSEVWADNIPRLYLQAAAAQ